jgi:hypothetical protein
LFARQAEELSDKTIEIEPDRDPPLPRIMLRWHDENGKPAGEQIPGGYAMKLALGTAGNGWIPGKILLCLPDEEKSLVAGAFEAEIRKPQPPRQGKPPRGKRR